MSIVHYPDTAARYAAQGRHWRIPVGGLDDCGYPKPAFLCYLGGDTLYIHLPEDRYAPNVGISRSTQWRTTLEIQSFSPGTSDAKS